MKANGKNCRDAEYWSVGEDGVVVCGLCPHHCHLREGRDGLCKVRGVRDGRLKALGYGVISSAHIDPVEKKPLYHFHPGAPVYSIGGWGCNFGCVFCQNWSISQRMEYHGTMHLPGELIPKAAETGCELIAYTYNEPLVGFEFVRDCCVLARERRLKNILVTNGYIDPVPAKELLPLVDALNVDIKSMSEDFYRRQCKGSLAPVLEFTRMARETGCHVEITNLVIPGLNDGDEAFETLARWIAGTLDERVPLHLSAYHPDYKASFPATPPSLLIRAATLCRRFLKYVYIGNVMLGEGQATICPGCGHPLIAREGYQIYAEGIRNGECRHCGRKADVIGPAPYSSSGSGTAAGSVFRPERRR